MTLLDEHKARAIEMMKNGQPPEAVHGFLVSMGAAPDDVHAYVSELVRLKHEAAARDPERLRGEAKWMLLRNAPIEEVVKHFASVGVPEEFARPEIDRIARAVAQMVPCRRCGQRVDQKDLFMDVNGVSICNRCYTQDEIGRSEQRGLLADLEMVGVSPLATLALGSMVETSTSGPAGAQRPYCMRCQVPSGVHVTEIDPRHRAQLHPGWQWICGKCGQGIA